MIDCKRNTMKRILSKLLLASGLCLTLAACGSAGGSSTAATTTTTTTTPTSTPTSTPSKIVLSASPTTVKSDGSDQSVITVVVLDAANAAVDNATVLFSATGGTIGLSAITDATGTATVNFSAGPDKTNQIVTITGSSGGVTGQIPVQIAGTTVSLVSTATNITDDGSIQDTLTVSVKDAGNNAYYNAPVTITQAGTGSATIVQSSANTNVNGQVTATITGTTAGSVTLTVSAAGAAASQTYTVSTTGTAFGITSPTADPYSIDTTKILKVTVNAPAGVTSVDFASTMGSWNGGGPHLQNVAVVGGFAQANFTSAQAGVASIQVYDSANIATSDTMTITIAQPATTASQISLQSNVNVLAPSSGGLQNSATLTATVRDPAGQAVGGASVFFRIPTPTGGGETLTPVVALTNSLGKATTTFTSGSISTGAQGVDIYAYVVGKAIAPAVNNIVIGGTAGSIMIGRASEIVVASPTEYQLPMSVLVADGNGNPVPNAVITMKVFPKRFSIGQWYDTDPNPTVEKFAACHFGTATDPYGAFLNEDVNRNVILEAGEDVAHTTWGSVCDPYTEAPFDVAKSFAANGQIDAPNSAAGTIPATVVTDSNGVGNFDLTYLKGSGEWIEAEVTASTQVLGTETTSTITFWLPVEKTEATSGSLPSSVFGQ